MLNMSRMLAALAGGLISSQASRTATIPPAEYRQLQVRRARRNARIETRRMARVKIEDAKRQVAGTKLAQKAAKRSLGMGEHVGESCVVYPPSSLMGRNKKAARKKFERTGVLPV